MKLAREGVPIGRTGRLSVVALACLAAVAMASGCRTSPCKQGTILVTVIFGGSTAAADQIDVEVTVASNPPTVRRDTLTHRPGSRVDSVEIRFPNGYPGGKAVQVRLTARTTLGESWTATEMIRELPSGCHVLTPIRLDASERDGGTSGSGGMGSGDTGSGGATGTGGTSPTAKPMVSSVNYGQVDTTGGDEIKITGTNFVSGATVTVDGTPCTSVGWVNATTITCVTPAKAAGTYTLRVINPDGQSGDLASMVEYWAPTELSLTGYWRAPFIGSPWEGVASAGASFGRNLSESTNPPAIGLPVNGKTPADFDGTNDILGSDIQTSTDCTSMPNTY